MNCSRLSSGVIWTEISFFVTASPIASNRSSWICKMVGRAWIVSVRSVATVSSQNSHDFSTVSTAKYYLSNELMLIWSGLTGRESEMDVKVLIRWGCGWLGQHEHWKSALSFPPREADNSGTYNTNCAKTKMRNSEASSIYFSGICRLKITTIKGCINRHQVKYPTE